MRCDADDPQRRLDRANGAASPPPLPSLTHTGHMCAHSAAKHSLANQTLFSASDPPVDLTSIVMSRKSVAAAAAPLPEVLLLGCEGVGKSCLVRQMKRCTQTDGDADVNLAAAPTVAHTERTHCSVTDAAAECRTSAATLAHSLVARGLAALICTSLCAEWR